MQKLGLKRGLNKDLVISPYSSFLALSISPDHVMNNLARLEKIGAYGKYGFYEACDFTASRVGNGMSIVKSYMAHHVGMSIIAAANACFDNIFRKRFISDRMQWSATSLLQEKIPVDAVIFEDINERDVPEKINRSYASIEKNSGKIDLENPVCRILSNSKSKIILSSIGHAALSDGAYAINYADFSRYNNVRPFAVMFKYKNEVMSPSKIPVNRENAEYMYEFTDSYAHYSIKDTIKNTAKNTSGEKSSSYVIGEAKYTVSSDMSLYTIALGVNITDIKNTDSQSRSNITYKQRKNASGEEDIDAMLYFEPILTELSDYSAHPAFSVLSIEAEYDEKNKVLFYKRRPRHEHEKEKWIAVGVSRTDEKTGKDTAVNFSFESRRDDILPHAYGAKDIVNLFERKFSNTNGACIQPVCAVKIKLPPSAKNRFHAKFNIAFAGKKEEVLNILQSADRDIEREERKFRENHQNRLIVSKLSSKEKNLLDIVLSCIYGITTNNKPDKTDIIGLSSSIRVLWKEGISGDLPIVLLCVKDDKKIDVVTEYLHIYKYLTLSAQKLDLVIVFNEKEKYNRPCQNSIRELIRNNGCEHYMNRRGGIYILERSGLDITQMQLLNAIAAYKCELSEDAAPAPMFAAHGHDTGETGEIIEKIPEIQTGGVEYTPPEEFRYIKFDETVYPVEGGRFAESAFYIDGRGKKTAWSHIISGRQFGTLVTHKSLGFTWYSNARERRLTAWENDPVLDMRSERVILSLDGTKYDLCAVSSFMKISAEGAEYYGKIFGYEYKISVTADPKLFVKLVSATFYPLYDGEGGSGGEGGDIEISYIIKPVMGVAASRHNFIDMNDIRADTVSFRNVCNMDFSGFSGYIRTIGGKIKAHDTLEFLTDGRHNLNEFDCIAVSKTINPHKNASDNAAVFALGCYKDMRYFEYVCKRLSDASFTGSMSVRYKSFIEGYLPRIKITTKNKALDVMFNFFLPYQNVAGRIFGRTGFYQSSGAFGYRDQLQDMTGLAYSSPETVKAHIYRAAAHQFIEGDVQHWWHAIKTPESKLAGDAAHRGVRTRCSDDYLWLPYVTAFYISKTGDTSVLDTPVEYITDDPLAANERERYGEAKKSGIRESVYKHCIKSIEYAFRYGVHGLPLMGTCDWNDGMSLVGAEGKGESVWLAQFLALVIEMFAPVLEYKGDADISERYRNEAAKIRRAIEEHCFEDDRYIRGFYDNGDRLGSKTSDECKIDILPQAFSAIISGGGGDTGRIKKVMDTAYNMLYDKKFRILKLFTPPFADGVQNPGYIKGYVAGIRENGGQYTHGALWGALGFLCAGEHERGYEVLTALNPAARCGDKELAEIYRIEPYVLSGDIYSNPDHTGRGGWSWYTGAASWYYRIVLESLLGFELKGGSFALNPRLPENAPEFGNFTLEIKFKSSVYTINISNNISKTDGGGKEIKKFEVDGIAAANPIEITDGVHTVDIVL